MNKNRFDDDTPSPTENSDAAFEKNEDQCKKSAVIKMLFKGAFEDNSREILKNLDKFSKIEFGYSDANVPEANFSTPESLNCVEKSPLETLVEETGSNVKESVVSKEDVLEEDVDIAVEMVNTWSNVFRTVNLMLLAVLTVCFTMIPIVRFALDILMYIRQFVVLFLLLTIIEMFIRINMKFMQTIAQKVEQAYTLFFNLWSQTMVPKLMKMPKWFDDEAELKEGDVFYFGKFESEYSSKWNVRKVSDVVKDQLSNTDRAARSVHEFEEYEQDVPDTLPLVENKLMLLFCAVNTDFTGMETEPDASVDSSFSPELYGKGHRLGQSRRYSQVRIQSTLYSALKFLL